MKNGSCNVENGSVKWKMEVGKWKSETRSGMAPIGHGTNRLQTALGQCEFDIQCERNSKRNKPD